MLQVFIGFFTIQGVVAPDDPSTENLVDTCGYILLGVGVIHIVLSCLCFSEYNDAKAAYKPGVYEAEFQAAAGGGASPPQMHGQPGPSAI